MADFLVIHGKTYTVSPLPTKLGLRTFVRVGKMMGPGFARLLTDPDLRKKNVQSAEMSALVSDLFEKLDDPNLEDTVEVLMNTIVVDGTPLGARWLTEFSGKLSVLAKLMFFAIERHFGDFMAASDSPASSPVAGAEATKKPNHQTKNG